MADQDPLNRLRKQLLLRWQTFPADQLNDLDSILSSALIDAAAAEPELITVMNPVTRPRRLQLATLVSDKGLDTMYQLEWAELAISSEGQCYLVYRRRSGGDYAIVWSPATTLPATMPGQLPESLALALLGGDENGMA